MHRKNKENLVFQDGDELMQSHEANELDRYYLLRGGIDPNGEAIMGDQKPAKRNLKTVQPPSMRNASESLGQPMHLGEWLSRNQ